MVKQRMSTADVAAEAACLRQRVLGMRLANIYDVNAKVSTSSAFACKLLTWACVLLCSFLMAFELDI